MTETIGYRSIVAAQSGSWLLGQILKAYFAVELRRPAGLFEHGSESCLILASMHKSVLDPFLIMSALRYRHWRALIPVRTLATQTFSGPLRWFGALIRLLYRVEGVIELPPKEEGGTVPEKLQLCWTRWGRATSSRSSPRVVSGRRVIHRTVNSPLASCTFSVEPERTLCRSRSGRAGGYGRAAAT